jgi:hypothetical protein
LYDLFQLFDYTDASTVTGHRTTSTVAPQALFLMNAQLVGDSARAFAIGLLDHSESEPDRIHEMYQQALGRLPTPTETARAQTFLSAFRQAIANKEKADSQQVEIQAWTTLCQVLLVSNELITVR